METCTCEDTTLGNTGRSNCEALFRVLRGLFYMHTYAADGTRNRIDLTDDIDDAYITAAINNVDPTKRWYPTGILETIGGERAEPVFAEAASGKKSWIKQGVRNVTAEIWDQSATLMGEIENARCQQISFFGIDRNGSLRGMVPETEDGFLYPIRVEKQSWAATLMFAAEDAVERIAISFNYDQRERDSLLRAISANDIVADLLGVNGLFGVEVEYSGLSDATLTATLFLKYGSLKSKIKNTGLLITDFFDVVGGTDSSVFNVTTGLAVTISTFTESSPGVYAMTFTAQTAADVIRLTPVKTGFEYSKVIAKTATL